MRQTGSPDALSRTPSAHDRAKSNPQPSPLSPSSTAQETAPSDAVSQEEYKIRTRNLTAFEQNASSQPISSLAPQALPTIASPHIPSPRLHLQIDVRPQGYALGPSISTNPDPVPETSLRQTFSTASIPRRNTSVRSTLSAAPSTVDSLSPASLLSSPATGTFADITPLPSPIAGGSPGPWHKAPELSEMPSPASAFDTISIPPPSNLEPSAHVRTTPKKHRAYHGLISAAAAAADGSRSQIGTANDSSHARNRTLSEYVPNGIQIPRSRNIAVSGSEAPPGSEPLSPPEQQLHREEYLALQRGLAPSVPRPPTPPSSNRSGLDSSDNESLSSSPAPSKSPLPLWYEARSIKGNKLERWRAIRQLGKGTFSTVMLATSEGTEDGSLAFPTELAQLSPDEEQLDVKTLVAVKICERGPVGGADEKKAETSLKRELDILKSIHHPSLVQLKAMNILETRALLVLNYCAGGDLFELASLKLELLVPSLIRRIFAELVAAVRYLHSKYIVHRDIKLENVLVNLPISALSSIADWQTYASPVVTLTDLGLGRWIPKPPESPLLETRCGSEDYCAPEVLMGQGYDGRATDAWALGVLLYAIMEGRLPFDPVPGSRRQSPASHRIARCEWSWVRFADCDGEWDPEKGKELAGAKECVEGLLKRARSRWALEKVGTIEWVSGAVQVAGGLRREEDDEAAG